MSIEESVGREETELRTETGWPFLKVGVALLLVAAVVLGIGFVLNTYFRPAIGVDPASTAMPAVTEQAGTVPADAPPTLEQEIVTGYLRFWEVRTEAQRDLDITRLPEVAAGDALDREVQQVEDLRAQGRAGKVDVEHNFVIVQASATEAVVYDEYLNKSLFIDLATGKELPTSEPPAKRKMSYDLRKTAGVWKVVDGARHP